MATADDIFKREFTSTVQRLGSQLGGKHPVHNLPNPLDGVLTVNSTPVYEVKGIDEEKFYSTLNGEVVHGMGVLKPERTVWGRDGKKKVDLDGNVVKERPVTPSGTQFIRSKSKVNVPYKFKDDTFNFADAFLDAPDGFKYIYAIPKSNLYRVNMTALAVSVKSLKCYSGYKFKTWHYGTLTLAVIPYNPNAKYTDTVILGCKDSVDYASETKEWVNYMIKQGIVPNVPDYNTEYGENLVMVDCIPSYDSYERSSILAITEEKGLSYSQASSLYEDELEVG